MFDGLYVMIYCFLIGFWMNKVVDRLCVMIQLILIKIRIKMWLHGLYMLTQCI